MYAIAATVYKFSSRLQGPVQIKVRTDHRSLEHW